MSHNMNSKIHGVLLGGVAVVEVLVLAELGVAVLVIGLVLVHDGVVAVVDVLIVVVVFLCALESVCTDISAS